MCQTTTCMVRMMMTMTMLLEIGSLCKLFIGDDDGDDDDVDDVLGDWQVV